MEPRYDFPLSVTPVEPALNKQLMNDFKGERKGFCQVGPVKWLLPMAYAEHAEAYYNMPVRTDDVFIITFPRSGTTWCQELVWLVNNNFDYETSSQIPLETRVPFLEFNVLHTQEFHADVLKLNNNDPKLAAQLAAWYRPGYQWAAEMASPRHFKSHLALSLLPPLLLDTAKVVYVARNPKDVAVSYYHHNRLIKLHDYVGTFEQYWQYFEDGLLDYSPYWPHILEHWEKCNHPNLLYLFYEEMIKDLGGVIAKVAKFLGKTLTEEQIQRLVGHLQIDNFRKNVPVNIHVPANGIFNENEQGFIRQGKVGGNNEFTPELSARADAWIEKHLAITDLRFPAI